MSLLPTVLNSFLLPYSDSNLDSNEHRMPQFGVYNNFLANRDGLFDWEQIQREKAAQTQPQRIPVISKDLTLSISNTRSCTIAARENNSEFIDLVFTTYAVSFTMIPSQYQNNVIKYQPDFDNKMMRSLELIATAVENDFVNILEADKSQVNNSTVYPFVGDSMQVTALQQNDFYNNLSMIMGENDYFGTDINVVSSMSGMSLVNRLSNQGSNNGINEQFQLSPYNWSWSRFIQNDPGIASTLYAMKPGSVGFVDWIDPDCEAAGTAGIVHGNQEWIKTPVMPVLGIPVGMYMTKDCSDQANAGIIQPGLERTRRWGFEMSVDIAGISAYNGNPALRPGSIFKAQIAA